MRAQQELQLEPQRVIASDARTVIVVVLQTDLRELRRIPREVWRPAIAVRALHGIERCVVTADLHITGKVAQFGRGILGDVSKKLMDQFAANLNTMLDEQGTAATPDTSSQAGAAAGETAGETSGQTSGEASSDGASAGTDPVGDAAGDAAASTAATGPTVRKIEALSRFDATPAELYVELTDAGYISLGTEDDVVSAALARALVDVLPDTEDAAMRVDSVKDKETNEGRIVERGLLDDLATNGLKVSRFTLDQELKRWVAAEYAGESGTGKKGSPHRYWMRARPPESFFRSKPCPPSEESILANDPPDGSEDPPDDGRAQNRSSDGGKPSEERIAAESDRAGRRPILSSDAPDAYIGRKNPSLGVPEGEEMLV